jgi:hypothetical protein
MKLLYLPLLAFLLLPQLTTDAVDTVAQLIGKGSVHELAKLFPAEVEIELPGTESDTYPKLAATGMLEKFFIQNKPISSKILHKINNNGPYQFGVVILSTVRGPYRVAFNIKNENGVTQVIKLRIEAEKVK